MVRFLEVGSTADPLVRRGFLDRFRWRIALVRRGWR